MEDFNNFKLDNAELIYGGELIPTYVGANGDYYDGATGRYIWF